MRKITDIYAKPNRRTKGQRRQGKAERRHQWVWVTNCRRAGQTDRRRHADRRPDRAADWSTFKTIKPIKAKFFTLPTDAVIGNFINISV